MSDKRIVKALSRLNDYIDDDRQQLCDRIKLLEKSHKRMLKVIKASRYCIANCDKLCVDELITFLNVLDKEIGRTIL